MEALATFIGLPLSFTFQADSAFTPVDFHNFWCAGVEYQLGWENHAHGFSGAIRKKYIV